jgi:penicillin-binding protein 1A
MAEKHRRQQNKSFYSKEKVMFGVIIAMLCFFLGSIAFAYMTLPRADNLENLQMMSATQVYDINGQLISKLFEENRTIVSFNNMSPNIAAAVIANEDVRFYSHYGIDPIGIIRAIFVDIRSGSLAEGGSTITQQLAKNMFLTQERTIGRKLKEALLALVIENKFSKQEILQAYLNQVYFGEGAYGVEAASQVYFGKHANHLSLAESAMLAGLPRGPNLYSPYIDLHAAVERRGVVLQGMVKAGTITPQQAVQAEREPIVLAGKKKRMVQASYFLDYVAAELAGRYGSSRVYKGGLKVFTTLDIAQQQAAEAVLEKFQGAVLILDPRTGYIKAMVGGRNYEESQINRVTAEIRQPGSAFKPFVYTTALNRGLTANTTIVDEPINIGGYAPQNYDKKYHGPITLKKALGLSVNVAAVKLGQQIGMDNVLSLASSMGITTLVPEDSNLAAALGGLTQGVNLMELCTAYTAFANSGVLSKPVAILKVLDENDQVLEETRLVQNSVLRPEIAYIMTDLMKRVFAVGGTGTPGNIGRPAAGKTGTTDNYETAWFIGYTPELLAGIFVGNDDRSTVEISGTQVSGMWGKMMAKATAKLPPLDFAAPANVITAVPICVDSGKLAPPGCPEIEYDSFVKGTEPTAIDARVRPNQPLSTPGEEEPDTSPPPATPPSRWKLPWL